MKRHTVDKIRAALAARTPGTWRITERGYGGVVVRLGDPELSPAFLAAEAKERRSRGEVRAAPEEKVT